MIKPKVKVSIKQTAKGYIARIEFEVAIEDFPNDCKEQGVRI